MKFTGPFSRILSLAVALLLTGTCSFVIPNGVARRSIASSTGFHVSLSEADLMSNLEGDDPVNPESDEKISSWEADLMFHLEADDPINPESDEYTTDNSAVYRRAKQIEIIKYNNRAQKAKRWCPFYYYLCQNQRSTSNLRTKALHTDDELNRMESKFYRLEGEDLSPINFPLGYGLGNYKGNIVRPNVRAYELVARAYSRARMGQEGVELAEEVIARYQKFYTSQKATTKMMTFVMKACISAGNIERTEYWLDRIEKRYEITKRDEDLPGYYVYNPYVAGLRKMPDLSPRTAAKRSMEVVEKMNLLSKSTKGQHLFPGRAIYLQIMEYQELGYTGSVAFHRIEKVFRELQKNYLSSGKHPKLKPSIEALVPVFAAASKCSFPRDDLVIKTVNTLFDEYDQLYKETDDIDFLSNGQICDSLNLVYARMSRRDLNLTEFVERTMILIERMTQYKVEFRDVRDKTSAFNRILLATERQLPGIPMSDPLKTRETFVTALDIFKKFHDSSANSKNVPPNKATYQIFLRLCAKLPEGETRSKLSVKAFQLCQQKELVTVDAIVKLYDANPEYALSVLDSTASLGYEKGTFDFLSMDITKEDFHQN